MLGVSLAEKDISKICDHINVNSQLFPTRKYGLIINQNRNLNLESIGNKKFEYRIKQRPFCLVGVYSHPITPEEIQEDYDVCIELFENEMMKNKGDRLC